MTEPEYRLLAFLGMTHIVSKQLSKGALDRLCGMARGAIKDGEFGLCPMAFEYEIAAHMLKRKFTIFANDLEQGGGFDFLAKKGKIELEIECKHLSADIGRKIHRNRFCQFAERIEPLLASCNNEGGVLLDIVIPERLTGADAQLSDLICIIKHSIMTKQDLASDSCDVRFLSFTIEGTPFAVGKPSEPDITRYLEQKFNLKGGHAAVAGSSDSVIVAYLRSKKPDTVIKDILSRAARDSKSQFTKERPALLCLFLSDLTNKDLIELAQFEQANIVTGIRQAVSQLLDRRPHLHTVALMAGRSVRITRTRSSTTSDIHITSSGATYSFPNTKHANADDPNLRRLFE